MINKSVHSIKSKRSHVVSGLIGLILLWGDLSAQPVTIGESIPDPVLHNVINYPKSSFRLSEFRNKLVILDFWAHSCLSCIQAFPKLDSLQKKFEGRLQIIAVNSEDKEKTLKFFARRKLTHLPHVPFVTGDSTLVKLFPRNGVPLHVWIDGKGVVRHITDGYNATPENVQAFLDQKELDMEEREYISDFDLTKPLFAEGGGRWLDRISYYSLLSECIPGASIHNFTLREKGETIPYRITQNCKSAIELLTMAFNEGQPYRFQMDKNVVLQVTDNKPLLRVASDDSLVKSWNQNLYTYDIRLPLDNRRNIYKMMQQDLLAFFALKASIRKENRKHLVLIRTTREDRLKTKGGKRINTLFRVADDPVKVARNISFEGLSSHIRYYSNQILGLPFLDKTGYRGNIDIALTNGIFVPEKRAQLKKELQRYGLDLVEQVHPIEVLVLTERE